MSEPGTRGTLTSWIAKRKNKSGQEITQASEEHSQTGSAEKGQIRTRNESERTRGTYILKSTGGTSQGVE